MNEVAAAVENPDSGSGEGSSSQGGTGGSKSSELTGNSSTPQVTTGDTEWSWDEDWKLYRKWDVSKGIDKGKWVYWDTKYSRGKYLDRGVWQWID